MPLKAARARATNVSGRQGYPYVLSHQTPLSGRTFEVQIFESDRFRHDDIFQLDTRVDKDFAIGGYGLTLGVDVFNLFNEQSVLQRAGRVNGFFPVTQITETVSPRTLRIGARLSFR
jgi:hypothetical protein